MKTISIWMTYDLGVGGDYQGMYSWLDDYEAAECGNNAAFVKFQHPENLKTDKEFTELLTEALKQKIKLIPSNRIYIVWASLDEEKTIGRFIFGKRKANSWEGFGSKVDNTIDG